MAGDRGLADRDHRALADAGVVLGDPDDQAGHGETDEAAVEQVRAGDDEIADLHQRSPAQPLGRREQAADRQHGAGDEALVERAHDRVVGAELDEVGADDRGDDAGRADGERIEHHLAEQRRAAEEDGGQHHRRDDRHGVGLEQVGGHAGAIADVVTDVVGDRGGVAWIILGDAGLDLADEIAADVRTLGEDAAAETGEDRDQRGAEAQRHQRVDDRAVIGLEAHRAGQEPVVGDDAQQREASHQHARDRARLEGDVEAVTERSGRGLRRPHVGAHRHVHADEAGQAGQDGADGEADRDQRSEQRPGDHEDDGADHRDVGVLALEIGLRAFGDRGGDLLHALVARVRFHHRLNGDDRVEDRQHTCAEDPQHHSIHALLPHGPGGSRRVFLELLEYATARLLDLQRLDGFDKRADHLGN